MSPLRDGGEHQPNRASDAAHNLRSALERAVAELPAADLPDAIGTVAGALARLQLRLMTPPPITTSIDVAELVTAEVVAERFHLAVSSVHEAARLGRIPCRMLGRFRRFDLHEVAAAMANDKTVFLHPK